MRKHWIAAGLAGLALTTLFGASLSSAAPKYESVVLEQSGTIVGVVRFDGAAPKPAKLEIASPDDVCHTEPILSEEVVVSDDGKLRWAVVSIKKITRGKAFPKEDRNALVTLDQKNCRFDPHVVVVPAGRTLRVLNSDGVLHNVHTKSRKNKPQNTSMAKDVKTKDFSFKRAERFAVACDVHEWMKAWIVVANHPYHVVSGADGTFRLDEVPVGTHTLEIWHEKLGKQTKEVTIEAGKETRVEFVLAP